MSLIDRVIANLSRLPGLGRKSASRIAYYLLKADTNYVYSLLNSIREIKEKIKPCSICGNYSEGDVCYVCVDPGRDRGTICVVEEPKDVLTIDGTLEYKGLYHVLMGVISPLDGIGPENLRIGTLMKRVEEQDIKEVIIATNPTVEGDTTALFISNMLKEKAVKVTRPALGLPLGSDLEYTDSLTLARALKGRNPL